MRLVTFQRDDGAASASAPSSATGRRSGGGIGRRAAVRDGRASSRRARRRWPAPATWSAASPATVPLSAGNAAGADPAPAPQRPLPRPELPGARRRDGADGRARSLSSRSTRASSPSCPTASSGRRPPSRSCRRDRAGRLGSRADGRDRPGGSRHPGARGALTTSSATPSPTTSRPATSRSATAASASRARAWTRSARIGPWIVTADEIPNPGNLGIRPARQRRREAGLEHQRADLRHPGDDRLALRRA